MNSVDGVGQGPRGTVYSTATRHTRHILISLTRID
jgi:hypothetical protein